MPKDTSNRPSRRSVIKGAGAALSLPWLEAMAPTTATAQTARALARSAAPVRTAFVFWPNGTNYEWFEPEGEGKNWQLSKTLEPLAGVKEHFSCLSGLTADKARANGDGPGDHARSAAAFLTGQQPFKTAGRDIRAGLSADQVIAQSDSAQATRLPSLELGCDKVRLAGNCDSGYACAYQHNISWASESQPMPQQIDPAKVFDQLFADLGDVDAARKTRARWSRQASVLDAVRDESRRLHRYLSPDDRRKLDEYTSSIREIERRIQTAQKESSKQVLPEIDRPEGIPEVYSEHIALMFDLMRLAFQTDQTRVSTFMFAKEGSGRSFPELDIKAGHHQLSHHQGNQEKIAAIRAIDRFYMEQFAKFIDKMANTPDGDGSLLDHSQILFGSGISDGNRHNHHNLPIMLAGRANGQINPGRRVIYDKNTPICNLYLSMMDNVGVQATGFGDGTGRLARL